MNAAKRTMLLLLVFLIGLGLAGPARADAILFYSGDYDPTGATGPFDHLLNVRFGSFGAVDAYENFIVPPGQTWSVHSLFSNDLALKIAGITSADWSIRTGVSVGAPGTVIDSGTSPVTITPTGRTFPGQKEYTFEVDNLDVTLGPGTYWFNVTPVGSITEGNFFITNTFGLNAVGSDVPGQQFRDPGKSGPFGNANDFSFFSPTDFNLLSAGVIGLQAETPEPATALLFGLGVAGLTGYCWRCQQLARA
jgi:hypothetical protein